MINFDRCMYQAKVSRSMDNVLSEVATAMVAAKSLFSADPLRLSWRIRNDSLFSSVGPPIAFFGPTPVCALFEIVFRVPIR